MSVAILILSHEENTLRSLAKVLDSDFSLFAHVDKKTIDINEKNYPSNTHFVDERFSVYWGGWSMMEATFALLRAALQAGPFSRYVLISGDSLPVVAPEILRSKLYDIEKDYIDLWPVQNDPSLAGMSMGDAAKVYGWVQPWRFYNHVFWDNEITHPYYRENFIKSYGINYNSGDRIRSDLNKYLSEIFKDLPRPKLFDTFWFGSQWWALTHQTIMNIYEDLTNSTIIGYFRTMQVPDEHMLQTILGNKRDAFENRQVIRGPIFQDDEQRRRGIDWLSLQDFRNARSHGEHVLFARKYKPAMTPEIEAAIVAGTYYRDVIS